MGNLSPAGLPVYATPGPWELERTGGIREQVIVHRPDRSRGRVRPVERQVDDLLAECRLVASRGARVLVTTLTKRLSEDLTEYLTEHGVKVRYLHSDIDTLERIEIIRDLRLGVVDVLVGINLLREGLDIPECALVAILDADKEGFLRSSTSLIQTIGRAARNIDGRVILYADTMTRSPTLRDRETERRRNKQRSWNEARHYPAIDQEADRPGAGERVRAGLRHSRPDRRRQHGGVRRQGPEGDHRRTGETHARRRRGSGIRGSRPHARRDQAAGGAGPRAGATAGRQRVATPAAGPNARADGARRRWIRPKQAALAAGECGGGGPDDRRQGAAARYTSRTTNSGRRLLSM